MFAVGMSHRNPSGTGPRLHAENRGWRTEGISAAETASRDPGPDPKGLSETCPHHQRASEGISSASENNSSGL
mgnify:CR=1 FL=1